MPDPTYEHTRSGEGRRSSDCKEHETRLDQIDADVQKQSGWLKATALIGVVLTLIIVPISSWFLGSVLTKLTSIESLLNSNNLTLSLHTEQIKNIQADVKEIQDRHKIIDQNGVYKVRR